jgi:hypothetical protein
MRAGGFAGYTQKIFFANPLAFWVHYLHLPWLAEDNDAAVAAAALSSSTPARTSLSSTVATASS